MASKANDSTHNTQLAWQTVFDTIDDCVLVINASFEIEHANAKASRVFNIDTNKKSKQKCYQLICNNQQPNKNCPLKCYLKNVSPQKEQIVQSGGRYYKINTSPIKNNAGQVEWFVDILHDITNEIESQKKLQEQLEENKALNEEYLSTIEEQQSMSDKLNQLNKQLELSERKYRKMFHDSTLGIFKSTFDGKFLEVNQAFANIFGYKNPQQLTQGVKNIAKELYVHPENRKKIIESLENTPDKKLSIRNDFFKKDGSIIHTNLHYRKAYDEVLQKHVIEGFVEDVSRQYLLSEQSKTLNTIVTRSPAVAFKWKNHPGWPVLFVSDNVLNLLGYSVQEVYMHGFKYLRQIHPDDRDRVAQEVEESSKNPKTEQFYHNPYRLLTKNGNYIWVNDHTFINRKDNKIDSYEGIILDCTEEVNATTELIISEEKFRTIFNMTAGLMCIADINSTKFIAINPAFGQILGYSDNELLNKSFMEFIHPDDIEPTKKIVDEQLKKSKLVVHFTNRYRHKNGRYMWIDWNSHPNAEKGITYAIGHNITDMVNARQALEESEERLRVLTDQSVDMIFLHDLNGNIQTVNLKAVMEYGYTRKEFTQMNIADFDVFTDKSIYQKEFLDQLERNEPFIFEGVHSKKNRDTFNAEIACTKIFIANNPLIITAVRDITERVKLQREQQFHSLLINNLNDFVTATDLKGNITFVNDAVCNMLGKTKSEILGQHVNLYGEDPRQGARQQEILQLTLKNGSWKGEIVNIDSKGYKIHLSCHTRLLTNDIGEPLGLIGISNDITERKIYEKQLKEKSQALERQNEEYLVLNEELEESLERIQDINIQLENREERLELLLKASREVIKFDDFEPTAKKLFELCKEATGAVSGYVALLSDNGDENEVLFLDSGGLKCTVDENLPMPIRGLREQAYLTHRAVYDNDFMHSDWIKFMPAGHVVLNNVLFAPLIIGQKAVGLIGLANKPTNFNKGDAQIVEAISELCSIALFNANNNEKLKNAKEKAEESDKLKSAFLANMSHEIRTPLNGILGFTDLLCRNNDTTTEQKEKYGHIIQSSSEGLLRIINDILDISKIESGQMKIEMKLFDSNSLINNLKDIFEAKLIKLDKNILLNTHSPKKSVQIYSDEDRIRQVLINLIDNAIKFTDSGKINFGYKLKPNGFAEYFVRDTGIGIEKEFQAEIFERFQQAGKTEKRLYGGNGLGLAISKNLVELMGGEIKVESEPGAGALFTFTIPLGQADTKNAKIKKEINEEVVSKSKKILVVEDDLFSRMYIEEILAETNAEPVYTESGKQALEMAKQNNFDLILMDIRLPDSNGLDIVKEIRIFNTKVHIIAQTAYAMGHNMQEALNAGCNDYISKPIKREMLLDKIYS